MARTKAPMIRRIPDETGALVTYLESGPLCDIIGISATSLSRWSRQGHVRRTEPIAGATNYAVADAARIRLMTREEREGAGIKLVPASSLRAQAAWYYKEQYETFKGASQHRALWDDADRVYIIDALDAGVQIDTVAKTLGRTYAAVCCEIDRLRASGDIPVTARQGSEWWDRCSTYLTSEEAAALVPLEETVAA